MAPTNVDKKGRDYVREKMPMIGLGTYQITKKETIYEIIDAALEVGYRFIDTAQIYRNEKHIGDALKELLPKHGLTRQDIFITTKLAPANQGVNGTIASIQKSLADLQTDYIDLLIIHWPGSKHRSHDPKNVALRKESWMAMEERYHEGELRAIGVSNYEIRHLEELLGYARVHPALNQVEYHPHFHQNDLVAFCKENDIHFQAYSSFGSPAYRADLWEDKDVQKLAKKYKVSVPIFLLAWACSQGISVLPRSSKRQNVIENFGAKGVTVDEDDIQLLLNNDMHEKACWDPSVVA